MSDKIRIVNGWGGIGLILSFVLWHAYATFDGYRCTTERSGDTETTECRLVRDQGGE